MTKLLFPTFVNSSLWGSSGVMESKEVLLEWIEADPVDTWELGRNDSIQSITGTRNVFVDYPELAFELFEEEIPVHQTPSGMALASDYVITATTNNSAWGTVSVSGSYINASPATGYEAAGYEIVSGSATVTQNGNSFRVSATSDVTVQINFAARTQKTVTFNQLGTDVKSQTAYSGDSITLSEHSGDVKTGYTFLGWVESQLEETTARPTFYKVGSAYTVTNNVTLYALYSRTEAGDTANSTDFELYSGDLVEGDYVVVCSSKTVAMKAEVNNNRINYDADITITDNKVVSPDELLVWHIAPSGESWTIYNESAAVYAASSGVRNNATLISAADEAALWTASGTGSYEFVNNSNADSNINATLRYNPDYGFACYSTGTGAALNLYKRASGTSYYFTVENEGNTEGGSGGETENETCTVTYVENDRVISKVKVEKGKTITLPTSMGTVNPDTFEGWVLKDSTETITEYIVNADVTFYAKYKETESEDTSDSTDSYYVKVTEAPTTDWSGEYLIVYEDGNVAFNGELTKLDGTSNTIAVAMTDNKIEASDDLKKAQFTIEKSGENYTVKSASGYYIGNTSNSNALSSSTSTVYTNTISLNADESVNIIGSGGAYLRYNATTGQLRFRYYKSSTYTNQKAITLYKLVESSGSDSTTPTGKIEGAQIEVGESLALNYYVSLSNVADDAQVELRVTMLNKTTTIARDTGKKSEDGKYIFTFDKITTQCMTVPIDAELVLIDGESENSLSIKEDYSIQQNAINLLVTYSNDSALKQFVTDMLYYGAASQTYRGYNTQNLATSNVVDASGNNLIGNPSEALPSEDDAMSLVNNSDAIGDVYFRSATVWFDTINHLIIKLNSATENTELKLNGEVVMSGAGNTVYNTESIKATDFDTVYTFELYEDGTLVQTLSYSVNAYAYSKMNSSDSNMSNLAIALYRYGVSAKAYADSLK